MRAALISGSSRSAGPWACRRPPITNAPRGSAVPGRWRTERLLEVIRTTHKRNYAAYGYRRTWKALLRGGERVPRCQVQRLMRRAGIVGARRRGKPWRTTKADPRATRARDLVERDFSACEPNRLWVGDFTYVRSWEGVS